jgi:hypothetical protein
VKIYGFYGINQRHHCYVFISCLLSATHSPRDHAGHVGAGQEGGFRYPARVDQEADALLDLGGSKAGGEEWVRQGWVVGDGVREGNRKCERR